MKKSLLIILLIFISLGAAFAQRDWQLKTDKEGIKIYTKDIAGSKIKALKVESSFNATPAQFTALIMDVNSATDWEYHVKSSNLIKRVSASELYYYSEVSLPWPLADRDFVAHLLVNQNPQTKVVTIDGPAINGMVPVKSNVVRVSDSKGRWVITPVENNQVKVEYSIHLDPGGTLPAWIINMFATEGPINIFRNIKTELQKPVYQNNEMAFVAN